MDKSFDKLNEVLNVESAIVESTKPEIMAPSSSEKDSEKDYEYARGQLYSLIEKGQEAVNGILDVAANSDHPRAYEVAGQLIKSVADVTDKLADLHKKMKDLDNSYQGPQNVTNALYVGSTADLLKLVKEGSKKD